MTAQMAKCVALRHEERVMSPITNVGPDALLLQRVSGHPNTSFTPGAWEGKGAREFLQFSQLWLH